VSTKQINVRCIDCASKAAIHSFSDTMRMELAGFGIKVVLIAPGAITSGIGAANAAAAAAAAATTVEVATRSGKIGSILKPDSNYANVEDHIRARGSWSQGPSSTPTHELAEAIYQATMRGDRTLMYGHRSSVAYYAYYLPGWIRDTIFGTFGTEGVGRVVTV
jgi:1-acylglycerone phosphate reductase